MNFETAPVKDPNSVLRHAHDWADWLEGETITASNAFCSDPALVIDQVALVGTQVRFRVSGGVLGQTYIVTSRVTTSTGRSDDHSVRYTIAEK